MSFHVAETPTLEAVATEDERLLAQDLETRVAEGVRQANSHALVREASEAQAQAQDRLERLRAAERILHQHAKEARERIAATAEKALEHLVEAAASGKKLDFRKLEDIAATETQLRILAQAIGRLVEHQIPRAQIGSLREEAHALETTARALEQIAQERAERVLEQLRGAVSQEMVLPVDLSKGVSGALLARASGHKRLAVQISENADRIEREYQNRRTPA
jgi:hypothetical protein